MSASNSKVLHMAKARHAYNTTVADQMSFTAGEMLHIIAKNGGWWMALKASNPAERGWVPSNYLSVVNEQTGELEKVLVTPRTQAGQVRPETVAGTAAMPVHSPSPRSASSPSASSAATGEGAGAEVNLPSTGGKALLYGVRALHRFSATQAEGLSFEKDELLSIVARKDGWLRGINAAGAEGWVPSNYVRVIPGTEPAASELAASNDAAATPAGEANAAPAAATAAAAEATPASAAATSPVAATPAAAVQEPAAAAPAVKKLAPSAAEIGRSSAPTGEAAAASPASATAASTPAASASASAADSSAEGAGETPSEPNDQPAASPRPDLPPLDPNMTPRLEPPTPRAPDLPTDSYVATPRSVSGSRSGSDTPEEEYRDQVGDLLITPRMAASIGAPAERVRASFNFDARKPDHLSFKKGDVMVVLKKKAGWWKVHHEGASGKMGYIPANYVTVIQSVDPMPNPTTSLLTAAGNVVLQTAEFEPSKERPLLVKATHAYKALANNQLSFAKHDLLHVISKNKGWWKAYRVADADKIGYIPSNYVRIQGPAAEGSPSASASASTAATAASQSAEGSPSSSPSSSPSLSSSPSASSTASSAPASAVVEMEEVAVALHDLEKRDPKCLPLRRDERFAILDRAVGGGWWRATSLTSGDTGLVPSNFLRTEMAPRRLPPPLPGARGSVPDAPVWFVEGSYDFTGKKASQLSYKKHDALIVTRKDGSWWKARNWLGKEGVVPYNHVREVQPEHFRALWDFSPRSADELQLKKDDVLSVLDRSNPAWWRVAGPSGQGWVPALYVHPISSKAMGAPSAPTTPRSAAAPEVPATPRNPDGTVRADPPVSSAVPPASASPAASAASGDLQLVVESGQAPLGALADRRYSGLLSASPLSASSKESAQLVHVDSRTTAPHVASVMLQASSFASPSATPRPEFLHEKLPQHLTASRLGSSAGFFERILPSAQGQLPSAASSAPADAPLEQEEGVPSASTIAASAASSAAQPAPAAAGSSSLPPYLYGEGEGEGGAEGESEESDANVPRHVPVPANTNGEVNDTLTGGSTGSTGSTDTASAPEKGGVEIGSAEDSRTKSSPSAPRACGGGWQSFFGVFAACTGANRADANGVIPKPREEEEKQETK